MKNRKRKTGGKRDLGRVSYCSDLKTATVFTKLTVYNSGHDA